MSSKTTVQPWIRPGCALGEGPCYIAETQTLCFIDLYKGNLHTINFGEGASSHKVILLGPRPSVVVEVADHPDELLACIKPGFAIINYRTGELKHKLRIWLNDGAVDPQGRMWAGSMPDEWEYEERDEGTLYRLDDKLTLTPMVPNITTSNGIGWSPDNKTMYFTDSHTSVKTIWAWDGWAVVQVFAETGKVMRKIDFPVARPTCPCFGDRDFDELFVTSALPDFGEKVDVEEGAEEGAVYRVKVGVKGCRRGSLFLGIRELRLEMVDW